MEQADIPVIFRAREAPGWGLTPSSVRSRAWRTPIRGTRYASDHRVDSLDRYRAAALMLSVNAAFSHVSALRIHGIEVPWRLDDDDAIHVVTRTQAERSELTGVVAHHTRQRELAVIERHGLRVTTPAQTWLHLAHGLSRDESIVLAEAMLRRTAQFTSMAELEGVVRGAFKVKGLAKLREALPLIRPGTDSTMESRMRLILVEGGVREPVVNYELRDVWGDFVALLDMAIPELRLALEYDGDGHRTDEATWRKDVRRSQRIAECGWRRMVFVADDVIRAPDDLVHRVRAAIREQRGLLDRWSRPPERDCRAGARIPELTEYAASSRLRAGFLRTHRRVAPQ